MTDEQLELQFSALRREVRLLRVLLGLLLGLVLLCPGKVFSSSAEAAPSSLTLQNLTIVDAEGNVVAHLGQVDNGTTGLKFKVPTGETVFLGSREGFCGLSVDNNGAKVGIGVLESSGPTPDWRPIGVAIEHKNGKSIDLSLDAEHRRPNLTMGSFSENNGFIDLGISFIDQKPYLKFFDSKRCRARLHLPPGRAAQLELANSKASLPSDLP